MSGSARSDDPGSPNKRIPGQVCDRCRRRKIRCHGENDDCFPCLQARVVCVTSASLKRARKRKSYYEKERYDQCLSHSSATPPSVRDSRLPEADRSTPHHATLPSPSTALQSANHELPLPSLSDSTLQMDRGSGGREWEQPTATAKEPVIGHMGRLVTDDQQIAMFGGSTTGVHFISQTEQQLQMLHTHKDALPSSTYSLYLHSLWGSSQIITSPPGVSDILQHLPHETLDIVDSAIDRWTPLYPIVHKPSLKAAAARLLQSGIVANSSDVTLLHQVLMLLALGSVSQAGSCILPHHHFLCLSENYYRISATLQDYVIDQSCLQSLQSLVLTQIYLQLSNRYSRASHLSGVATRLAQTLGLHRHSLRFKFDPLETELRRRAWWCQYSLDAFGSAYHGMPRLIRNRDVDTDFPMNVDHELLSRTHVQFPLPGETSQVDTALRLFKLARIVGSTLEELYTTTQRRGGVAKIGRLQVELDAWAGANESVLAENEFVDGTVESEPPEQTLAMLYLKLSYNVAAIHIHRPALSFTAAHPQYETSLRICGQASASLIRLLAQGLTSLKSAADYLVPALEPEPQTMSWPEIFTALLLFPNGVHMLWQAGLTVIFTRLKGYTISQDGGDETLLFSCIDGLRRLHSHTDDVGDHVRQCAEVLDLLRMKVFSDAQAPLELEQLQWNIWDWPLDSALELANTLNTAPLDLQPNLEAW